MNPSFVLPWFTTATKASLSEYSLTMLPHSLSAQSFSAKTIVNNSSCEMCSVCCFTQSGNLKWKYSVPVSSASHETHVWGDQYAGL